MIVFDNPGEIDPAMISTFGVSVKEGDNPIGFFGTGLKYAIAILLRTGHSVSIWSGLERLEFGTERASLRGKDFDIITMNGDRLGFTTELGKTWELWMAYRELFCNARDENGDAQFCRDEPDPIQGQTQIIVHGPDFEAVHHERWKYFLEDEPDLMVGTMQIWRRPSVSFFYRGMKVAALPRPSMFTYSETAELELTEDRTLKHDWTATYRIGQALLRMTDTESLKMVATAPEQRLEGKLDCHGWGITPSAEFIETIGELASSGVTQINPTMRRVWAECAPKNFKPTAMVLTTIQMVALDRAIAFCKQIGFPVDEYPIVCTETLGTDQLGRAYQGQIYVAARAFDMGGAKQLASVLIEEWAHLKHRYEDCTRSMQNWLFERMVSLGEELVGEPL